MNEETAATLPETEVKAFSWKNLLTTALDGVGNIFGNNTAQKSAVALAQQRAKTQRTILIIVGALAAVGLAIFGMKKR